MSADLDNRADAGTPAEPDVDASALESTGEDAAAPEGDAAGHAPVPDDPLVAGLQAGRDGLRIRLTNFEGPLDLLLHLLRRDKIEIHEIPISTITHQYLEMIESMRQLNLEVAGEFLVMAATLMRIKSRTLLPPSPVETEEEQGDSREDLIRRLVEYRKYKEVAENLRQQEERRALQHDKGFYQRVDADEPVPLKPISLFQLMDVLRGVMARRQEVAPVHAVELPPVTVEERMEHIRELLAGGWGQVRFEEVVIDCRVNLEIVTTVVALLEMMRLGEIVVRQYEEFGDIWVFDPERLG